MLKIRDFALNTLMGAGVLVLFFAFIIGGSWCSFALADYLFGDGVISVVSGCALTVSLLFGFVFAINEAKK